LLISIIPVINVIAPLLWLIFGAWAIAMEYLSYPADNRGLDFQRQKQLAGNRRISVLSFGLLVNLGLMLPLLNLVMGQAAVIGATLMLQDLLDSDGGA
jgi:CysZ protein